jgi:hypothetical protein
LNGFHVIKKTRLFLKHAVPRIETIVDTKRHLIAILAGEYGNPILGILKFVNRRL